MGRRIDSIYEVTEFELNKSYGFKSQSGYLETYTLYTFAVVKGKTRVNIFAQLDPGEMLTASDTVSQKRVKKQYRENFALLKDVLETTGIEKSSEAMQFVSGQGR
jgi:hypothetical protein